MPALMAPWTSSMTSSPIMTKSPRGKSLDVPVAPDASSTAEWKNSQSGFPTTVAVLPVANSSAATKGPACSAKPSSRWKYRPLFTSIKHC